MLCPLWKHGQHDHALLAYGNPCGCTFLRSTLLVSYQNSSSWKLRLASLAFTAVFITALNYLVVRRKNVNDQLFDRKLGGQSPHCSCIHENGQKLLESLSYFVQMHALGGNSIHSGIRWISYSPSGFNPGTWVSIGVSSKSPTGFSVSWSLNSSSL